MPPRKTTTRKQPAPNRRRSTPKKNQKQMSAGVLLIFVPLLLFIGYMMIRNSGSGDKKPVKPVKTSIVQKQKPQPKMKEPDTLAPPPEPLMPPEQKPEPQKQNPEVTGQDENPQQKPEPQIVEKKVETISAVNAVKLFMFDRKLSQDSMTQNGSDMVIKTDSDRHAAALKADLKTYLINNKLDVTSSGPLTIKDSTGQYTVSFSVEKPKPEPKPQKPEPKPQPVKKQEPVKKPQPAQPQKPAAQKPQPKPKPVPQQQKPTAQTPQPAQPKPAVFKAKLALVIDDCGYNTDLARKATSMGYPVTLAVIPYTPAAAETARIAKSSGNTLFLHLPMQPKSYPSFDPGKGALLLNMPEQIIASIVRADVESIGAPIDGANNHTGSAFTEDGDKMAQALSTLKNYAPRFLDSRTTPASKAYDACRKAGMRCGANSLFLDNETPTVTSDGGKEGHVHDELIVAAKMALSRGSVIVIGHLRKDTVAAFPSALAEVERMGVKIVPVTQLMN